MSRTINKVELLGRVGTDPEMQYTPGGTAVTKLRLATDRYRKDAENETDWHNIVVWGATAEAVNQYVGTGQRVYVAGRLVQNSWEGDDGQRRHRTEIHASEVVFLDSTTATATATPRTSSSRSAPLPSSRSTHNRIATPSRRRATGPLPTTGGGPALCSNR